MPIEINGTQYDANVVVDGSLEPHDVQLGNGTLIHAAGDVSERDPFAGQGEL